MVAKRFMRVESLNHVARAPTLVVICFTEPVGILSPPTITWTTLDELSGGTHQDTSAARRAVRYRILALSLVIPLQGEVMYELDQFVLFGDSITQNAYGQDRGFGFAAALQHGNISSTSLMP